MAKISTTDIKDSVQGSGGIPKVIQPGNHTITIHAATLDIKPFNRDVFDIVLHVESDPIEGFEGFWIDKEDQSKGKYLGQVAKVRATEWYFNDAVVGGVQITKVDEVKKWLLNFCKAIGKTDWLNAQDNQHETIEDLIAQFSKDKPFKELRLNACLAGKSYINKENFVNYDLYLPRFTAKEVPIELVGTEPSKLTKFSEAAHIKTNKKKPTAATKAGGDFDL